MRWVTVGLRSAPAPGLHADLRLAATLYLPDPATPAAGADLVSPGFPGLVVSHGAGSRRSRHDAFCREACSQGFAVLAVDLRGHGESAGTADGPLEEDLVAAAAFLRAHPAVDAGRICYRGSSLGGFYGLKAAPQAGFAALALVCPASEQVILDALPADPGPAPAAADLGGAAGATDHGPAASDDGSARWDIPRVREYFLRQDSLTLAGLVGCPVLLVHARGDEVVPFEHSLALTRRLAGDVTLLALAGGSHTSAQHDTAIHRLTASWLLAQVTNACTGRT